MGIVKVVETRAKVAEISLELEKKKVLVGQLQKECEEFLGKIVEQKNSASERERVSDYLFTLKTKRVFPASSSVWNAYCGRRNSLSDNCNHCP